MKKCLIIFIILFLHTILFANEVYKLETTKETAIIAPAILLNAYGFYRTANMGRLDTLFVNSLSPENINAFDRPATANYNPTHATISDVLLGAAVLSPFALLSSDKLTGNRLEAGAVIAESYLVTAAMVGASKVVFQRKRPYAYNPAVHMQVRQGRDAQMSFFSGHTALAFNGAVLTAKMYSDVHGSKNSGFVYGGAVAVAATVGYLRVLAGRHFPSDVLVGAVIGTASAVVISEVHKTGGSGGRNVPMLYLRFEF